MLQGRESGAKAVRRHRKRVLRGARSAIVLESAVEVDSVDVVGREECGMVEADA